MEPEVNTKLVLWQGDLCALEAGNRVFAHLFLKNKGKEIREWREVDALLAPVAAGYVAGCSTVFQRILQHGRQDGWDEK